MSFSTILHDAEAGQPLSRDGLVVLLAARTDAECAALHNAAYRVKQREVGAVARMRGLVEVSNTCVKNCLYCGIRSGNTELPRFRLARREVMDLAALAHEFRYGSVVLQAGERQDPAWVGFIEDAVRRIKAQSNNALGVTLSLGEQTRETYRRWFAAGAHRYLLRIETSSPTLYAQLHPKKYHAWQTRAACLDELAAGGWQVGTGVMCGLPGQTLDDLAGDILFFREKNADMLGMGPWIPHSGTPLGREHQAAFDAAAALRLGLNMIAVARLALRDVNIASTTALQALAPDGRERGLLAGANVLMPNLTPAERRAGYQLYDNKPFLDENARATRAALEASVHAIGETIARDDWGDSPHFAARTRAGNK